RRRAPVPLQSQRSCQATLVPGFALSIIRVICHCWAIDRMLFTTQYSTRPDGNHRNMKVKMIGMPIMTFAWIGSGGVGLSLIWISMDAPMMTGRMKYGSLAERSWIQPSHGA